MIFMNSLIPCPHCGNNMLVDGSLAGQVVVCPTCHVHLQLPKSQLMASTPEEYWPPSEPAGADLTSQMPNGRRRCAARRRSRAPSLAFGTAAILLLVCAATGMIFWKIGWFENVRRNAQRVASAVAKNVTESGNASSRSILVSGELFVTTKGGDVKKGAGQRVYFTPITADSKKQMAALLDKADKAEAEVSRIVDEGNKKYHLVFSAEETLEEMIASQPRLEAFKHEFQPRIDNAIERSHKVLQVALENLMATTNTVADSEGKFNVELPPGRYVLWTLPKTIVDQTFSWCTVVDARDAPLYVILSEDSVFFYSISFAMRKDRLLLLRKIAELADGK
jgi:hypothetical protein